MAALPALRLTILVGGYVQARRLGPRAGRSLGESVSRWREFAPDCFPPPHPSWRNNGWFKRNPWFETEAVPALRSRVAALFDVTRTNAGPRRP